MQRIIYNGLISAPAKIISAIVSLVGALGTVWPKEVGSLLGGTVTEQGVQTIGITLLIGAVIYFACLWLFKPTSASNTGITSTGDNSPAIGRLSGGLNYHAHSAPKKFSATQEVNNLPPPLGGNQVLSLAGVATLRLHVPYSEVEVTMRLDAVPQMLGVQASEGIEVTGAQIVRGKANSLRFDTQEHKRHILDVAGSVFVVTLLEVDPRPMEGIGKAMRYKFSVVER